MKPYEMAKLLANIIDGSYSEEEEEYIGKIDAKSSVSNTFVVTDKNTNDNYIVTVKKVSK